MFSIFAGDAHPSSDAQRINSGPSEERRGAIVISARYIEGRRALHAVLACLALSACAVREVTPVSISNPDDDELTCTDIRSEIGANEQAALELAGEEAGVEARNTAAAAVGVIVWPALFARDLSNAEKIQAAALRDRNQYLESLHRTRGCASPAPTSTPVSEPQS